MSEYPISFSGSGNYELVQIPLSDISPTQAGFGDYLTEFVIGANWGSNTILLDDIRVTDGSSTTYHRADEDQSCDISEQELINYINLWYMDSTVNPMREMMEAVGYYYGGSYC